MKQIKELILAVLLLFASAVKAQEFIIPAGEHYSQPRKYTMHNGVETMVRTVIFDSSCIYNFGDAEDGDINKTFGWGIGITSYHSIRIGWNCKSGYAIDLYAYLHYNGKRYKITKDSSSNRQRADLIGKGFYTNVPVSCRIHRARDTITFEAEQGTRKERLIIRFANFPNGYGFYQWPYFGGTYAAPHTMKITLQ